MPEAVQTDQADRFDVDQLMTEVEAEVARLAEQGHYSDARIARAERMNLANIKDNEDFLAAFIRSLRAGSSVDINDFTIQERRQTPLAPFLVRLKHGIWSLLKFYTYRLWSQQNTVNGLFVTGIESLDEKYQERIRRLEARIAELEKRAGK